MPELRQTVRGLPPFAPAYAHYTHRLQTFIEDLRGLMTVSDLAAVTGLGWDTVKHIIKAKLEKDYGHPRGFLGVICGMDVGNTGHIKLGCPSPKRHSQAPFQFPAW